MAGDVSFHCVPFDMPPKTGVSSLAAACMRRDTEKNYSMAKQSYCISNLTEAKDGVGINILLYKTTVATTPRHDSLPSMVSHSF